ncbi:hypothetical protein TNCV_997981 [Trichonephila clavipes]|nr:hypothetical protein TNCV_997981 [Trichonephila clavipes]
MLMRPSLNKAKRVNMGVFILEHSMFSRNESLKHWVKMICENTLIMVACNYPLQNNEKLQFKGRYNTPHYHRALSIFLGWNQAVNVKCFCQCLPNEHTSGGLEQWSPTPGPWIDTCPWTK